MSKSLNPMLFVKNSAILSILAVVSIFLSGDLYLGISLMITSTVFIVNLWGWIWSSRIVLNSSAQNPQEKGKIALIFMKSLLFFPALFVIFLAFGVLPVLISNSIIVLSLCGTVFYTALSKRFSNG